MTTKTLSRATAISCLLRDHAVLLRLSYLVLAVSLSLLLATITTVLLLVLCTPLAWWLSRTRSAVRPVVETIVAMPLVLPPTVIGFYLLIALAPSGPLGGLDLLFSFPGLVFASLIYSLPFVVQPLQTAFAAIPSSQLEQAATLRAGKYDVFRSVVLPQARLGFITAAVLGFAHTVGEFGIVLMIGGSIPGETRVASIAIYEHVEQLDYASAHALSASLLGICGVLVLTVYLLRHRSAK